MTPTAAWFGKPTPTIRTANPRGADGVLVTAPKMSGGHTVFVAVGNLFAYLCLAATLGLLAGTFWIARRTITS